MIYQDTHVTIYNCNALALPLADESVQCVVTSPPYYGLRKYAGEQELVWGNGHCEHVWGEAVSCPTLVGQQGMTETDKWPAVVKDSKPTPSTFCNLCGCWRGAYGLEPTVAMYVQHTVEILAEIKRVLRKDGVCFWNVGDSYAGGKGQSGSRGADYQEIRHDNAESLNRGYQTLGGSKQTKPTDDRAALKEMGIKPKDLCLIPQRVAIAAQDAGWWVRSIIIWSKPNPMPESVTDRPTESHEYILMLTKSARYYWNQDAVREKSTWIEDRPSGMERNGKQYRDKVAGKYSDLDNYGGGGTSFQGHSGYFKSNGEPVCDIGTRNLRSVWEITTQPYPEAHFATFPEELPKKCIMAASKEGDTILDPFGGSGTTGKVAKELNRKAVLTDLSAEYCKLAVKRVSSVPIPMDIRL